MMTDQNQDNQNPKPEGEQQPYMPPPVPQQETSVEQPQTQQPAEPVQPQPQPQQQSAYQQQATQGQAIYQGQPNYGQQEGHAQQGNYGGVPPQDMPDTYMTLSVIATVIGWLTCCASSCIGGIVGIVAIVFSSQVANKYAMGDFRGAKSSSETAKILAIVSFVITGLSILVTILYLIFALQTQGFDDILNAYKDALDQAR